LTILNLQLMGCIGNCDYSALQEVLYFSLKKNIRVRNWNFHKRTGKFKLTNVECCSTTPPLGGWGAE
jgi:hypothetical protein